MVQRRVPCLDDYLDRVNLLLWPRFKVCQGCCLPQVIHAGCALAAGSPDIVPVLCLPLQSSHFMCMTSICVLLPGQQSVHVHSSSAVMVWDAVC